MTNEQEMGKRIREAKMILLMDANNEPIISVNIDGIERFDMDTTYDAMEFAPLSFTTGYRATLLHIDLVTPITSGGGVMTYLPSLPKREDILDLMRSSQT